MTQPNTIFGRQVVNIAYPTGAGGNYIAALCALSQQGDLRHGLMNYFYQSPQQKYNYLKQYLTDYCSPWWEDFDFGNDKMWLLDYREYSRFLEFMPKKQPMEAYQYLTARSPYAKSFYHGDRTAFWVTHSPAETNMIVDFWSDCRLVVMVNCQTWLEKRMGSAASDLWKPEDYANVASGKSRFYFDTSTMHCVDDFCMEMQRLYAWLGFTDYCMDWIANLHRLYLEVIDHLIQMSKKSRLIVAGAGSAIALVC